MWVRRGKGKATLKTKGWTSELVLCEFRPKDEAKLRVVYDIPKTIKIQIPNLSTLDSDVPPEMWIVSHENLSS